MKITTSHGRELEVETTGITFITGPMGTDERTRVLGVLPAGAIGIDQDTEAFVASLPNKDDFVKLTFAINGAHFWANAKAVTDLRNAGPNDVSRVALAASVITFNDRVHRFLSTEYELARAAINAAGGDV